MVEVETGIQDDEFILIKSGVEDGQEVVTGPYRIISKELEEGMNIRRKEDKSKKDEEDS